MNVHFTVACVFPERDASLFYDLVTGLFTWQRMWKRNLWSRLIARCFGFPLHNFLTCSDSQKFRVSAYRQINTVQFGAKINSSKEKNVTEKSKSSYTLYCEHTVNLNLIGPEHGYTRFNKTSFHSNKVGTFPWTETYQKYHCLLSWVQLYLLHLIPTYLFILTINGHWK